MPRPKKRVGTSGEVLNEVLTEDIIYAAIRDWPRTFDEIEYKVIIEVWNIHMFIYIKETVYYSSSTSNMQADGSAGRG